MSSYSDDERTMFALLDEDEETVDQHEEETGNRVETDDEDTVFASDCDAHLLEDSSDSESVFQTGSISAGSSSSDDATRTHRSSLSSDDATRTQRSSLSSSDTSSLAASSSSSSHLITAEDLEQNYSLCSTKVINSTVSERTSMQWMATAPAVKDKRFYLIQKKYKNDPCVASLIHDPNVVLLFSVVKIEIMFSSMHESERFGQFNLTSPSGNASATLLSLFGEAFGDSTIGALRYSATAEGMFTQTGCHTFELHGERRSKGVVFFEMLCADDHDLPAMSTQEQLKHIHKFYGQYKNVVGYRMVVGFCDPDIKPDEAIRRVIVQNSRLAGTALPSVKIDTNSESSKEVLRERFEGDIDKFEAYVARHNKKADISNAGNAKLAAATKDWAPTRPKDFYRQCTSYYHYYALAIAPFYEFPTVDAGHTMTAILSTTDSTDQLVQKATGCNTHFSIKNQEATERLRDYDVCASQADMSQYLFPVASVPEHLEMMELCFPMQALVYCTFYLPHIKPAILMELPFPWAIHPIEIALESQRELVEQRQRVIYGEHDAKMLEEMDPAGVQYFSELSAFNSYEHDSMVKRQVRKANDVAEVDERYYTKAMGGLKMPTSQSIERNDSNVFKVVMPIDEAVTQHLKWLEEIDRCSPSLTEDARLAFMSLLEQSGGRLLQSVFNTQHDNHIGMMKSAIVFLRKKEQKQETMYHEMVTTFDEYGVFGSYMAESLLVLSDVFGLTNNVGVANDVRIGAMRVVHCHEVERYHGDSGDKLCFLFFGAPGSSKTHTADKLEQCWLPGTKEDSMSMSERANNTYSARGGVLYKDEADATIDPSLASTPQAQTLLSQAKSAITNHKVFHTVLTTNQDASGADQIRGRKTAHLETPWPAVRLAAVNDRHRGKETSYASRWLTTYWKNMVDDSKMKLLKAVLPISDGNRAHDDPKKSCLLFFKEMFHKEQAWHTLVASAVAVGRLPYPNTQLLRIYWHVIAAEIAEIVPSFLINIRAAGTYIESYAKALCVANAVQIMFRETSPLTSYDPETNTTTARPFDLEQVGLLKPYLFLHESAAIFTITRFVHLYILPSEWYIVADAIAREFCSFYGDQGAPANNRPSFDIEDRPQGAVEVLSVLKATTTRQRLYDVVCSATGHTPQTAREIIELLGEAKIRVPWVYSDPNNKENGRAQWTGMTKEIPFLSVVENEGAFGKSVTIRVSTHYLVEMTPSKVMARMLRTISHRGMRSRKVMLGVENPKKPSTFLTAKLGPGKHVLKVPQTCMMSKEKQSMFFGGGLTAEKRSIMPDIGGTVRTANNEIVFDGDVETIVYNKWALSIGITDETERMARCPKNLDADIRYKHETFPHYKGKIVKNYPYGLNDVEPASSSSSSSSVPRPGELKSTARRNKNAEIVHKIWDGRQSFVDTINAIDQSTRNQDPLSLTTTTDTIQIAQVSRSTTTASSSKATNPLDRIRGIEEPHFQELSGTAVVSRKRRAGGSFDKSSSKRQTIAPPAITGSFATAETGEEMRYFNITQ